MWLRKKTPYLWFLKQLMKQSYKITILSVSPTLTTGHRKTQPTQLTHKFELLLETLFFGSSSKSWAEIEMAEEHLDVLTKSGHKTGISKPRHARTVLLNLVCGWVNNNNNWLINIVYVFRGDVHRDGDYHRAVHMWIFAENTQQLLLQRRADCKDSWPGLWDISSAGHISAGDSSLVTAR